MSTAESGPVTTQAADDRTKFGNEMFGKGAAAERKRIAEALGKPELVEKDKFEAYFKDQKNAEEKRLAEQGRYQELADQKAREAETERSNRTAIEKQLEEERFRNQFILAAQGKVADIDLALSQTKPEDRQFGDNGRVVGIDSIIDRILKEKPILKAGANKGPVGGATNGAGGEQEHGKYAEQIKKHEAEMEEIRKKPSKSARDIARLEVLRSEIRGLKTAQ